MNFNKTTEFTKDFKRLSKKYKSLSNDLLEFKKVISKFPFGTGKHFIIFTTTETVKIVKARFFCRYLKKSSLRTIYAYHEKQQMIEFIELYFKGDKKNEDRDRIKSYLKSRVTNIK